MPLETQDDPVVAELKKRGVQPTAENYNRMSAAMKGSGWGGGHAPTGNIKPMTLMGQVPDDMQYGAKQPPEEVAAKPGAEGEDAAGDQYGKEMSEADSYLDQIAGKPQAAAGAGAAAGGQKQVASATQNVPGGGKQDMGTGGQTEQPELNNGQSNMGGAQQPDMNEGTNWIGDALAVLLGSGAAAAGAKILSSAPRSAPSRGGEVLPPDPNAMNDPRQMMIEQEMRKALPPPREGKQRPEAPDVIEGQKPRYRVPANKPSDKGTETVSAPDEKFQAKSKAGYDKAKSEGRVGRPSDKAKTPPKTKAELATERRREAVANMNKAVGKNSDAAAARKKALGVIAKKAARK